MTLACMGMDEIWDRLAPGTQDWLAANNGDAVPKDFADEIDDLADAVSADDIWALAEDALGPAVPATPADDDDDGEELEDEGDLRYLSDSSVDWVEQISNDE